MGQAQRSDRRSVSQGRAKEARAEYTVRRRRTRRSAGSRTNSAHRNSVGKDISVISGGGTRAKTDIGEPGSRRGGAESGAYESRARDCSGRRRADSGGLEDLELWEISREDDDSRMMRLADRNQVRPRQRPSQTISYSDNRNMGGSYSDRRNAGSPRPADSIKRRRARRRQRNLYRLFTFFIIGVCLVLVYQTTGAIYRIVHREKIHKNKGIVQVVSDKFSDEEIAPPEITEDLLEVNDYSRPGTKLQKVKSVFVHYTANPGTSAAQNRSYFANLAKTRERSASAHLIIGYEGEVIQCIPLEEQAYAVVTRNEDSISIECCYLDKSGEFTQETYDTLVHTLAWLKQKYQLSADDILRHYDCGGKKCPLYYVEHEDAWEKLLADVEAYKESL